MDRNYSLSGIGLGIYLIAMGVAYFLDVSSGTGYLSTVFKLYPVLPILLGIDYILPNINPESDRGKSPEGWVVTIIILITIGGLAYSAFNQALNSNWNDMKSLMRSRSTINFDRYEEKTDTQNFELPDNVKTVRIENNFGDTEVHLNQNDGKVVNATADIKFPVLSKQKTAAYREELGISGETQGDLFLIKLRQPETKENLRATANITVAVPPGISVEIENTFGKIDVTEIRGDLKINNSNGRIDVGKVTGDVNVNNRFSSVDIGEVGGSLKVDVTTGSVNIEKVEGSLTARNSFGSLKIGRVAGPANITSSNGGVEIGENNGSVEIENSFGDISLERCSGSLSVKLSNGRLRVNAAKVEGPYDIDVKFGGVSLEMPSDSKFSLDAKTSFGNITSDFDIERQKETTQETATGKVNGGGPLIKIKAGNGNISLTEN